MKNTGCAIKTVQKKRENNGAKISTVMKKDLSLCRGHFALPLINFNCKIYGLFSEERIQGFCVSCQATFL